MSFVETAGDIFDATDRPYLAARMGVGIAQEYQREQRYFAERQALHRLKKGKFIKQKKTANGLAFILTKRGAIEVLRQRVPRAEMMDGDFDCMVIFDIPERHRSLRRKLTQFLEAAGFIRCQKSVFISPFDAFLPLAELFSYMGADEWVKVYRAERITLKGRSALKRNKRK